MGHYKGAFVKLYLPLFCMAAAFGQDQRLPDLFRLPAKGDRRRNKSRSRG